MKPELSEEVREALARKGPVVSLESSVIAQGLPWPVNLENARACEQEIREQGAVPATIAVLRGSIRVGLSADELEVLAKPSPDAVKIGSRDLPFAVMGKLTGGTTVSATCEISAAAGIRLFATGGIGGVHREVERHLDISQDLWALSRFPVGVVCAGAKSVLDLPKTLEALESLGVLVAGVGTLDFPSFYSRTSGLALEHSVKDATEAARMLRARFIELGQQGGALLALPVPVEAAIDPQEIELQLAWALQLAREKGVGGKAVTPFLLAELSRRSGGRTMQANLALLKNNARFAAKVAVAYS